MTDMLETFLAMIVRIPGPVYLLIFTAAAIGCILIAWQLANADGALE